MVDIVRDLEVELAKDRPKAMTIDEMRSFHKLLKEATNAMTSRLFVLLTAQ